MFGKRSNPGLSAQPVRTAPAPMGLAKADAPRAVEPPPPPPSMDAPTEQRPESYFQTKSMIFGALIEAIDLSALSKLDQESAREEIRDIVHEIVTIKNLVLSISEQEDLLDDICNDVLGFGPLEPLLARDDIADIMVNGPTRTFIEVGGKIQLTNVRFRDNAQLMNICQRIVSQVGRRVDEASPICDARLLDGSRVNVIAPPLAIDGAALTIRKFKKDKLTLDQLVRFGAISPAGAEILKIIGRVRCNVVISGGTGSGKTTLLNLISGLLKTDAGHLSFSGHDMVRLPAHQREIGYVFQDQLLFPHMSVERNLRYGERAGRISFSDLLGFLKLEGLLQRRPATLSGGEKQRVALGRALLSQPKIMLLDEPLANLDQERKDEILPYLENLHERFNTPSLFVSHNAEEVKRLAARVLYVADGMIIRAT